MQKISLRYIKRIFLFLVISANFSFAEAQYQNIKIFEGQKSGAPNEPSIMINPQNTNEVVAGTNFSYISASSDGGKTWSSQKFVTSPYGTWGDPCIITDTSGNFFYFHLSNSKNGVFGSPGWIDRIVCQKSSDGGNTWSAGTFTGLNDDRDQDKEWACYDPLHNMLYVVWTQFDRYGSTAPGDSTVILFSRSSDGGESWSAAKRINTIAGICLDGDDAAEGAMPATGPNGEVYVVWCYDEKIFFNRSTDQGETWLSENIVAAAQPGGWDYSVPGLQRCNGLPVLNCNKKTGEIFLNWTDQRNGEDDTDVWLAKSSDGGNTWSAPVRVNNDPAGKQNFLSWMAIDQATGKIYIVFYDRRNLSGNFTELWMASSADGGKTFFNEKISSNPFLPNENIFLGDYNNVSAHKGKIRPAWIETDGAGTSVWTAIIDEPQTGITEENIFSFSLKENFPNPFLQQTIIYFSLEKEEKISLELLDLTGRKILSICDEKFFTEGNHSVEFDNGHHRLPAGAYLLTMQHGNSTEAKKIFLLK